MGKNSTSHTTQLITSAAQAITKAQTTSQHPISFHNKLRAASSAGQEKTYVERSSQCGGILRWIIQRVSSDGGRAWVVYPCVPDTVTPECGCLLDVLIVRHDQGERSQFQGEKVTEMWLADRKVYNDQRERERGTWLSFKGVIITSHCCCGDTFKKKYCIKWTQLKSLA